MKESVKGNHPRTIKELVAVNYGASLVFPDGVPDSIEPPDWPADGKSELDYCQREFFLRHCNSVPDMPLEEFFNNDCICFMNVDECVGWLSLWMCASFYCFEYGDVAEFLCVEWTLYALQRCLREDKVPVPLAAVEYFAHRLNPDPDDEDNELYRLIVGYRQRNRIIYKPQS